MFCNAQFIFCLLYYIHIFFSILKFFLLILFSFQKSVFVSAFIRSASYSNMRLSLIFAGLIFANMRLANLVPTSRRSNTGYLHVFQVPSACWEPIYQCCLYPDVLSILGLEWALGATLWTICLSSHLWAAMVPSEPWEPIRTVSMTFMFSHCRHSGIPVNHRSHYMNINM